MRPVAEVAERRIVARRSRELPFTLLPAGTSQWVDNPRYKSIPGRDPDAADYFGQAVKNGTKIAGIDSPIVRFCRP